MPLTPGTKLESYEILSLLGSGGMGEVYRARDSVLKREVAIKILPSFDSKDTVRLHRFEQEAQATAALNHPNILAIHQFGTFQGAPYLVSELLEGSTLRQLLDGGPLSVRRMIELSVPIARGLAAAHEKGIVHRDLKPENLFLTKDGRIKILDFGLAKLMLRETDSGDFGPTISHETEPGTVMGTAGYMAPEQVRGQPVDPRADIFSFGAILYEMLEGERAFKKPSAVETMSAILNEDPPAIARAFGKTAPGMLRVVHRCLEKNPAQRFQSASDLAFALETSSESGDSLRTPFVGPAKRRTRRHWLWAAGLATAAVLAAIAFQLVGRLNRPSLWPITHYTKITLDNRSRTLVGADSTSLYIIENRSREIERVTISNGVIDPISIPVLAPRPFLFDVSPDSSSVLISSVYEAPQLAGPLWNIHGRSPHPLGKAIDAAFSPDGKFVAYSTQEGDMNLVQSDGTGDHKLASLGGQATHISWKPDASSMRFTKGYKLWELKADGSALRQVLPGWHEPDVQPCGSWSPDGSFYFFTAGKPDEAQIWALDERPGLFGKQKAEPIQLTSDNNTNGWGQPIPSKDGKSLFARGYSHYGQLSRYNPKTKQFEPYLGKISGEFMSFSKDGKSVAYVSFPEGTLWRANLDGSSTVQLTGPSKYVVMPRWSPDGKQILFSDLPARGNVDSYTVSSEGGNPQSIFPSDKGPKLDPDWSPDGRSIVYCSCQPGGGDLKGEIRILDRDTLQVTTLPGSAGLYSPRWSPDGRYIAAMTVGSFSLRIFEIATQHWSILPQKEKIDFPTWSRDSQFIYFLWKHNQGISRIRAKGGEPELIADLRNENTTGKWDGSMTLDPNDLPLILLHAGYDEIFQLTLEEK